MNSKHFLAAAALAALGTSVAAQQGTTGTDMSNPSADTRGTPAGTWGERGRATPGVEMDVTVQPGSQDSRSRGADQQQDMRNNRGDKSGTPAGTWSDRERATPGVEMDVTVQPRTWDRRSRGENPQQAPTEFHPELYGGD